MQNNVKVTKSQLKKIVKECLLEILSEGLGAQVFDAESATTVPKNSQKTPSSALVSAIKAESRGNPLMAEIFADTAAKTLPRMLSERSDGGGSQLQEQFSGNPEDVFGEETSSKWANLAFSSPRNKKN